MKAQIARHEASAAAELQALTVASDARVEAALQHRVRSVLGSWVDIRRLSHLSLFLAASRMVLPKILVLGVGAGRALPPACADIACFITWGGVRGEGRRMTSRLKAARPAHISWPRLKDTPSERFMEYCSEYMFV